MVLSPQLRVTRAVIRRQRAHQSNTLFLAECQTRERSSRCSTPRNLPILRTRDAVFYLSLRRRKRGLQVDLSRGRSIKITDIYDIFILERYGTSEVNPVHAPGVGPELSNSQLEEKLLDAAGLKLCQAIMEVVDVPRLSVPVRHTLHHHATVACLRSASSVYMTKANYLPTYLKGERWASP